MGLVKGKLGSYIERNERHLPDTDQRLAVSSGRVKEVFDMPYAPIAIDRKALTIMGVPFPDIVTLENTAEAIDSNMFEGFQPTRRGIEIIRDYCLGKMSFAQLAKAAREKSYEE